MFGRSANMELTLADVDLWVCRVSMKSTKASSPGIFCLFFPFLREVVGVLDSPRLRLLLWLVPGELHKSVLESVADIGSRQLELRTDFCQKPVLHLAVLKLRITLLVEEPITSSWS